MLVPHINRPYHFPLFVSGSLMKIGAYNGKKRGLVYTRVTIRICPNFLHKLLRQMSLRFSIRSKRFEVAWGIVYLCSSRLLDLDMVEDNDKGNQVSRKEKQSSS